MNWKEIGMAVLKKVLVGTVAIFSAKAVSNILHGKDVFGRKPNPEKTRVDEYSGNIWLGTDDYEVY